MPKRGKKDSSGESSQPTFDTSQYEAHNQSLTTLETQLKDARAVNKVDDINALSDQLEALWQSVDNAYRLYANNQGSNAGIARLYHQRSRIEALLFTPNAKEKVIQSVQSGDFTKTSQALYPHYFEKTTLPSRISDYTTHQLVLEYNDSKTLPIRRTQLEQVLLGVIEQFSKTKVWTPGLLAAILPIAACQQPRIAKTLLEKCLQRLKKSVLIDPVMLAHIGQLVRFANHRMPDGRFQTALDADDLMHVLQLITEQLDKLHQTTTTQAKLGAMLQALTVLLNAMVDQEVKGLDEEKTIDLAKSLRSLTKDKQLDPDINFYASYAHEALARLPDGRSVLSQYLGCGLNIAKGVIALTNAARQASPMDVLESIHNLKSEVSAASQLMKRHKRNAWYEQMRIVETYVMTDRKDLKQLQDLLNSPDLKPDEWLAYGIGVRLLPLLNDDHADLRRHTYAWLVRLTGIALASPSEKGKTSKAKNEKQVTSPWPADIRVQKRVLQTLNTLPAPQAALDMLDVVEILYRKQLEIQLQEAVTKAASGNRSLQRLRQRRSKKRHSQNHYARKS